MNKILQTLMLIVSVNCIAFAGLPVIGTSISQNNFNAGSSSNFFLVGINDGDPALTQNVTVTGVSSNIALLQIAGVSYNSANTFAVVNLSLTPVASITGIVTVTISAMDIDGTTTKSFAINIGDFYTKGALFSIYDLVFWQQIVPQYQYPNMTDVLSVTSIPQYDEYYQPAKLTVGAGVTLLPWYPNDWALFFTDAFTGYIKPTVSGIYTFKNSTQDNAVFYFNTVPGGNIFDSRLVISCGGTSCGVNAYSVYLQAGNYYPFHTANWVVFAKNYSLMWTGPGINTFQNVSVPYLYPTYDRVKPVPPTALTLVNKGVQFLTLQWKSTTDNDKVISYNLYQDGVRIATLNDSLYVVTALGANTQYSFTVTANDRTGNESLASNILTTTTYPPDNTPPTPPTNINFVSISDMSAEISWTGAADVGSEVIGYYVYLNGSLYNTQYTSSPHMVLKVLVPGTANTVAVEAFDGAFNRSARSATVGFNTLKFNPLTTSTGVRKARVNINPTRIARNPGFGLHFGWGDATKYTGIFSQYATDIQPGVVCWGDLSANPASFSAYAGTGKSITIGKFMQFAVDKGAYAQFTCGVEDNTDWRTTPSTFTRFMEYIGDPTGQTPGGALRISEGYIDPFISSTNGIILEFGDEVWGGAAHNAEIGANYTTYGQWCRSMAAVIKNSPYYDSTKIFLSYSGRNPDPADSYALNNQLLTGDNHEVDWISISGYLGGTLSYSPGLVPASTSELNYYKSSTEQMLNYLSGLKQTKDQDFNLTGKDRPFYFYQANMTDPSYTGRLGQAVTLCDYFFASEKLGVTFPSIFSLSGGEWSLTDASNNAKLPLFNLAALLNNNTKGNILKSDIETIQILKNANGLSIVGEPVGVHVFNNGTQYAIALFSREFDSDYQVQLNLPDNGVYGKFSGGNYTAKKYVLSGDNFSTRTASTNFTTVPFRDSLIVTVPQYSAVLYVFDGPDLGLPTLPLGYTKYKKIDALKIVNISSSPNISAQYGSATFTIAGLATNITNKNVIWRVSNPNHLDVIITSLSGVNIISNGTCESNGVISLKVMSAEDTTVYDRINVTISGQLTDGLSNCGNSLNLPQYIAFPAITNKLITSPAFPVSANASSGLPVVFSVYSGPASISGNIVTLNGTPGTVVIRASQPGSSAFAPAADVDQSFIVSSSALLSQTISLNTIDDKFTNSPSFTISATASSGLPVTLAIVSGPASLAGNTINLSGETGTVIVKASQAGNSTYNPAPDVFQSFQVTNSTLLNQTITFDPISTKLTTSLPFTLTASASSGLPVSFSIVSGPASVSANTLNLSGTIGVVVVKATQTGNVNYNPASPVTQIFLVSSPILQNQTITFDPIPNKRGTDVPFSLTASSSSNLPVVFELVSGPAFLNGNIISLSGSDGVVKIRAKQDGDGTYNPATYVEQVFGVCALPVKPVISASGPLSFCLGLNVTLTSSASNSVWSNNQTTASVVVTSSGSYMVTTSGIYGCATASDPVTVAVQVPPVQNICLVTVDDASGYNQVVFEKAANRSNVDRYKIMRETDVTNQFDYIGTLFKNDFSQFSDNTSNPASRSYRYKIELTDICGNKSYGDIHQTMHLTINKGTNANTWNLIWSAYQGIAVTSYRIYRGVSASTLTYLESVSGNFTSYTDNSAPVNANLYYVVEILSDGCNPQARTESYTVARSNVSNTSLLVTNVVSVSNLSVSVFPNPSNGIIHLKSNIAGKLNLYNLIGVKVRTVDQKVTDATIEGLQSGIYLLEFVTDNQKWIKKVVVE